MALIILNPGETSGPFGGFSSDQVFGSTGNETAVIAANGVVELDGSFNAGGDTIKILGDAGDYSASVDGSTLVLTSAGGANIVIPFGAAGATVEFNDASRTLAVDGADLMLGDQTISVDGTTDVANGDGGGGEPGEDLLFTAQRDTLDGTSNNDHFDGRLDPINGLQVNSVNTGDQASGAGGADDLYAQLTRGSTYGTGNAPIQPQLDSIETVKIEALQSDLPNGGFTFYGWGPDTASQDLDLVSVIGEENFKLLYSDNTEVFFNAKDVTGHDDVWSWRSDANLTVLDLTTLRSGVNPQEAYSASDARNTSDITIGMGYTGSDNTNWDASDLHVFFDPDFLLSGQTNESVAYYFILDQDADEIGGPLLDNINVDGIRFTIDGGAVITLRDPDAQHSDTHANFVALLQDELQALIDSGVVPADTTLTLDPTINDTTFLDNGTVSSPIPAIVLTTNTAAIFTAVGFSQVEDALGEYNVYGRLDAASDIQDVPVSVQIALEKAGEAAEHVCDGGALVVGSMDKYEQGIPIFNVTVYGDDTRPSILRYLDSTGGELETINISSDNSAFDTGTYASLAIGATNYYLTMINASAFYGDLQLGDWYGNECECGPIYNLYYLLATGGGDVDFYGYIDGDDETYYLFGAPKTYITGEGDDTIYLEIEGDALDHASDSLTIITGGGDDEVFTESEFNTYPGSSSYDEYPNHVILKNVDISTGDGDDFVWTEGAGNFRIDTGTGRDVIFTDNSGSTATWIFNVDGGAISGQTSDLGDLPGVPLQHALIGGGSLTIVFSGAGAVSGAGGNGGGVMEEYGLAGDEGEAVATMNGIESTVTINVEGSRNYYGTQADINDAILRAINDHPVLSEVLVATINDNNTLVVHTKIDGYFVTEDLDLIITPPVVGSLSAAQTASALGEAIGLGFADSTTAVPPFSNPLVNPVDGDGTPWTVPNNQFYWGVDNNMSGGTMDMNPDAANVENLVYSGSAGSYETDNVINAGADDDLIVLATSNNDDVSNGYWSLDGRLFDDASNEVIVFAGPDNGHDTIFNFETAGVNDYVPIPGGGPVPNGGFDFLDYTAYLQTQYSSSGSSASTNVMLITLDDVSGNDTPIPGNVINLDPNEVGVMDFVADAGDGEFFSGLTASVIQGIITDTLGVSANLGDGFGNLDDASNDIDVTLGLTDALAAPATPGIVGNIAHSVLKVQDAGNLGVYKDFLVTWDATAADLASANVQVSEIGSQDFGASLGGLDELNLVGSSESFYYDAFGLNQFGPDTGPFAI
ncbi:MAG: hypothetical protein KUG65_06840 [Sphingomonadaceae bacterium]|nr:hypothetical protein [Sphingomonadaceae bacterium]